MTQDTVCNDNVKGDIYVKGAFLINLEHFLKFCLQFSAIFERNYCHGKFDFFAVISYKFLYADILEKPH